MSLFASAACVGILAKLAVVRPAVTSWQGGEIRVGQGMSRSPRTLAPDAALVHGEQVAAIQIGSESTGKSQNELATFGIWTVY